MVADSLAKQEEEGILCSPTSQIENVNEEEMDTSISHYKRKVSAGMAILPAHLQPRIPHHLPVLHLLLFFFVLLPDDERL